MPMLLALLLQAPASLLVQPLYLDERPPELRTLRHILIADDPQSEQDEELARSLVERLRKGADFRELLLDHSIAADKQVGGILGNFTPGILEPALDGYLFRAPVGEYSDPIRTKAGLHILQRLETYAAVLAIEVKLDDEARREEVTRRLAAGDDFAKLALELSCERESAQRGGQFAIYERGLQDRFLKALAFELPIGGTSEAVQGPNNWHWIRRVALDAVDPALREDYWVRMRGILVQFDIAEAAAKAQTRNQQEAKTIADSIVTRLRAGERLPDIAAQFNEDRGGMARQGDLGWIHRRGPFVSPVLKRAALQKVGEIVEPQITNFGYLIAVRER
ncbi:MAG: hypothetical protein RL277_2442 [Planctomycetota bacterium]